MPFVEWKFPDDMTEAKWIRLRDEFDLTGTREAPQFAPASTCDYVPPTDGHILVAGNAAPTWVDVGSTIFLETTWVCDYCGNVNRGEQLTCGEGETHGCGAAKP